MGLVPELPFADFVEARYHTEPRPRLLRAPINQTVRRFPDLRTSYEFAGDLFEPLRQINSLL